jgi:hypothetical protein
LLVSMKQISLKHGGRFIALVLTDKNIYLLLDISAHVYATLPQLRCGPTKIETEMILIYSSR